MMRKFTAMAVFLAFVSVQYVYSKDAFVPDSGARKDGIINPAPPMKLPDNSYVQKAIRYQLGNREWFSKMLGLSKYYFPIYEKAFREAGIPDELKYISVIESELNPHAVSRAGAAGPWQFLYEKGKQYGLAVNDSIDERKDPVLASKAAAVYLKNGYNEYKDWMLAVASYNCGPNRIKWAMESAGGQKDYWAIRQYLPVETQNYVPKFIATVNIMTKPSVYNLVADHYGPTAYQTELLTVDKPVSLADIATQGGIPLHDLTILNPSYSRLKVNATTDKPRDLVIPYQPQFIYEAICRFLGVPGNRPIIVSANAVQLAPPKKMYYISYKVQDGDTLATIAEKFKVSGGEEELKRYNKLNGEITAGTLLKIGQEE